MESAARLGVGRDGRGRDSGSSGKHLHELAEVHAVDLVDASRVPRERGVGLLVVAAPGLARGGGLADGVEGPVKGGGLAACCRGCCCGRCCWEVHA